MSSRMSNHEWESKWRNTPFWPCQWGRPGTGRWWKRQLSKARRRYARALLAQGRGKEPVRYERECNWKLW